VVWTIEMPVELVWMPLDSARAMLVVAVWAAEVYSVLRRSASCLAFLLASAASETRE